MLSFAHVRAPAYARPLNARPAVDTDEDQGRGEAAARAFGADYYADHDALLQAPGLPGVIVRAPNVRHHDLVVAAARAGRHVFSEKPLATTREDGKAMMAACA